MTTLDPVDVPGATPASVCAELRRLAAHVPAEQAIVEIGVFKARSLCHLGQGAREGRGAHVWGVDPWDLPGERKTYLESVHGSEHREGFTAPETREAAERHVSECDLGGQVTLIRGFSADVARTWDGPPVGMLYVDGDHRADGIRTDFDTWEPRLAPAAVVAFDDHCNPFRDVIVVVRELAAAGRITKPDLVHGRLAVASTPGGG